MRTNKCDACGCDLPNYGGYELLGYLSEEGEFEDVCAKCYQLLQKVVFAAEKPIDKMYRKLRRAAALRWVFGMRTSRGLEIPPSIHSELFGNKEVERG